MLTCKSSRGLGGKLLSDELLKVRALISGHGVPLIGSIIKDAAPGKRYFAIVPIERNRDGGELPSARRLEEVSLSLLHDHGYSIEFVLSDPHAIDVESGLRAALATSCPELVASVVVALHGKTATVWVEVGSDMVSSEVVSDLKDRIGKYFASFPVTNLKVQVSSMEDLPSVLACLRVIRKLAPVDIDQIVTELRVVGFNVPSVAWLSHRLDTMRKAGRVVRLRNGAYALTAGTLRKLGSSKGRMSPDVMRMLAMARRSR